MDLPRVVIISTVSGKANELALGMGGECLLDQDIVRHYIWNVDNKYYTAQILLCTTECPSAKLSIEDAEALIVYHDPQVENAEEKLNEWSSLISSLSEADVLLFSCNTISDASIRDKVTEWCLHRKFELVELNQAQEDAEPDSENNKYGINRIIEALHAHMWPNMILKGNSSETNESRTDVGDIKEQLENVHLTQDPSERLRMESVLDGIMGGENSDFGELFGQLMAMKEHAASLPTNERRLAAEQLVTAFWKAMGGDASEIED